MADPRNGDHEVLIPNAGEVDDDGEQGIVWVQGMPHCDPGSAGAAVVTISNEEPFLWDGAAYGVGPSIKIRLDRRDNAGTILRKYFLGRGAPDRLVPRLNMRFAETGVAIDRRRSLEENGVSDGANLTIYLCGDHHDPAEARCSAVLKWLLAFGVLATFGVVSAALYFEALDGDDSPHPFPWPYHDYNYGVVMDAGSVHTTVNVFRWPALKTNGTGFVSQVSFCEDSANTGISSFADKPDMAGEALLDSKCLKEAVQAVPAPLKSTTPLFLGATAGMRILNATDSYSAKKIMSNLTDSLDSLGFLTGDRHGSQLGQEEMSSARILSSDEEGVLGWITANQLSGTFNDTESDDNDTGGASVPIGALDWGGASAQISFVIDSSGNDSETHRVDLFGRRYDVFTASHLCYGQKEASRRHFVELVYQDYKSRGGKFVSNVDAPCLPASKVDHYAIAASDLFFSACTNRSASDPDFQREAESNPRAVFRFVGRSDYEACDMEVRKAFDLDLCRRTYTEQHCFDPVPRPAEGTSFLAFSTYWYLVLALGMPAGKVSQDDFGRRVEKLCRSDSEYAHGLLGSWGPEVEHTSCFKGIFMDRLLRDGYNFSSWTDIDVMGQVSGAEVGWTLGYMVRETNSLPTVLLVAAAGDGPDLDDMPSWAPTAIIVGFLLLGCLLHLICRRIHKWREGSSFEAAQSFGNSANHQADGAPADAPH